MSGDRVQRMLPFQRLNHFPGMLEICRKGALSKHMARMAARMPSGETVQQTGPVQRSGTACSCVSPGGWVLASGMGLGDFS